MTLYTFLNLEALMAGLSIQPSSKTWLIFANSIALSCLVIFILLLGMLLKTNPIHIRILNLLSAYYLTVYLFFITLDFKYDFTDAALSFNQNTTLFVNIFNLIATLTTIIFFLGISNVYFSEENSKIEFTLLVWFIYISGIFLISNTDFIITIILLECIAFSSYILVGFERKNKFSTTSALQYLILASIPGGIFILGITLLYENFGSFAQDYLNFLLQGFSGGFGGDPLDGNPQDKLKAMWKTVREYYLNDPKFRAEAQEIIIHLADESNQLSSLFTQARALERVLYFLNPTIMYQMLILEDILIKDEGFFYKDFEHIAFRDVNMFYIQALAVIDIVEKELVLLEQYAWAHYYSMNPTLDRKWDHMLHLLLYNMFFNTLTWLWLFEGGDILWADFNAAHYQVEEHLYVFQFQLNSIIKNFPELVAQVNFNWSFDKKALIYLDKLIRNWQDTYVECYYRKELFLVEPKLYERFNPRTTGAEYINLLTDIEEAYHFKTFYTENVLNSKDNTVRDQIAYFNEQFGHRQLWADPIAMNKTDSSLIVSLSIIFLLVNICFKLTAAPFHLWAPTIYGGSPLATVTFLSIFSKVTIIFFTIWLLLNIFDSLYSIWQPLLIFISVLSIIFSILGAFHEKIFKRFFVYSSMSHVGFMLAGITILNIEGAKSSIDYLVVYILSSFIIWFIIMHLTKKTRTLINLKGLSLNNSWLSFIFSITIFSLSGIPPMAGFFVKFEIFNSIINSSFFFFAYSLFLLTVISFFYYLRLIKIIYFENLKTFSKNKNLEDIKLRLISYGFLILILFAIFAQKSLGFLLENILINSLR